MAKPEKPNKYAVMAEVAKQHMEGGQGEAPLHLVSREAAGSGFRPADRQKPKSGF